SLSLRSSPSCAGIALVELITAFFVLTLGLFGAIRMYHFCLDKTRAVHEAKTVMRALNNEIEHLRALPFADLENGQATSFRSETPGVEALVNASTTVAIEDYASPGAQPAPVAGVSDKRSPMPGLKRATVRIRWTGENGRTITKELVTLIADKG
ncbi:MAG TPA: hypothetical protein HPP77_08315, partial [Candidatus Hydrogenedentes bacterium]|nr:hypothetical protein [Candidatus Hydrogenedentota bacterium]